MDSVQVFVETVQQKRQQLLGVLLLEAVEPRRVLRYCPLEGEESEKCELMPPPVQINQTGEEKDERSLL